LQQPLFWSFPFALRRRNPGDRISERQPREAVFSVCDYVAVHESACGPEAEVATAGEHAMSVLQNIAKAMGPTSTDALDDSYAIGGTQRSACPQTSTRSATMRPFS
jgi:GTP cyclohydrolase FolE2